jgi:hypothetical protein
MSRITFPTYILFLYLRRRLLSYRGVLATASGLGRNAQAIFSLNKPVMDLKHKQILVFVLYDID